MTLVQTYHCKGCGFRFGPIGVGPYVPERPQVFCYCRDCSQGQSLVIRDRDEPLACAYCKSTRLVDVRQKCPVCASSDVHWETSP